MGVVESHGPQEHSAQFGQKYNRFLGSVIFFTQINSNLRICRCEVHFAASTRTSSIKNNVAFKFQTHSASFCFRCPSPLSFPLLYRTDVIKIIIGLNSAFCKNLESRRACGTVRYKTNMTHQKRRQLSIPNCGLSCGTALLSSLAASAGTCQIAVLCAATIYLHATADWLWLCRFVDSGDMHFF